MSTPTAYTPRRPGRSRHLPIRGLDYHVITWGEPAPDAAGRVPLVLLHGWMDVGASFQFLVDALRTERPIVALDWRGFGLTSTPHADSYWFPDYLGDLDGVLDALHLEGPIDLLGHSMGGNVVMLYAGVRPQRVRRLVNLEGFGLPDARATSAPRHLEKWLDQLREPQGLRDYASVDEVAERLVKNNPRLAGDKARWLAGHWAACGADGRWRILGDPAHKRINPVPYRKAEALACWERISAPVLWVEGRQTDVAKYWGDRYPRSDFEERLAVVRRLRRVVLEDAGHMLHHDQPEALAAALDAFLEAPEADMPVAPDEPPEPRP
jgi:pimeloyl-ACP methyl ester carboxylesterase